MVKTQLSVFMQVPDAASGTPFALNYAAPGELPHMTVACLMSSLASLLASYPHRCLRMLSRGTVPVNATMKYVNATMKYLNAVG